MTTSNGSEGQQRWVIRRRRAVAVTCAALALSMIGASFAAVPLYRLYCKVTGYAGTTQRAEKPSTVTLDRTLTVHFDANVASNLPWTFVPVQRALSVKIGENALAFYRATNNSDKAITGVAVFNVSPDVVGLHFNKVQCFCFTEQRLQPGQTVDMAVSFFVDPGFVTDEDTQGLSELTLSYTFYPADNQGQTVGQAAPGTTRSGG